MTNYLKPLKEIVSNPSGWDSLDNFAGEIPEPEWLFLLSRSRDSDELTESNWRCALKQLGGESENVSIDRFGHWACGWWESLSVREGSPEHEKAKVIASGNTDPDRAVEIAREAIAKVGGAA